MKRTNRKLYAAVTIALAASLLAISVAYINLSAKYVEVNSHMSMGVGVNPPITLTQPTITTTYYIAQNGKQVACFHHPGSVTQLGMNYTLGKITGDDSAYNMTQYLYNATYVSIGNQGTLNTGSTVLPGEWNRTAGSVHDQTYNSFNVTAVFYPDAGPHTADCIGLNFVATNATNYSLWGYDTFTEVTGIDNTFTITVEIKVSLS